MQIPPEERTIELNVAAAEELASIEGIDIRRAEQIVAYRDRNGLFSLWEDLEKVPELDRQLIDKLRERVILGARAGAPDDVRQRARAVLSQPRVLDPSPPAHIGPVSAESPAPALPPPIHRWEIKP